MASFIILSKYSDRKRVQQDLSRKVEPVYELKDERPVKVGETNIYEKIQASRDECDIYNIIKRYESGDFSVIGDPNAPSLEGDFTNMPTDIITSMDNVSKALDNWNKLPQGFRDLYHNNVTEFMKASPEDISSKLDVYSNSLKSTDVVGGDK